VSRSAGLLPRPARGAPAPRRAFSLIELLLVIGLFLTLMGIAVASVVRAPRLNRLIAAEQVISDAIRQARHTARTTGQPVVLRVRKDTRSISGLVTQPLWHGTEGWPGQVVAGVTGAGLLPSSVSVDSDLYALNDAELAGGQRLWSGSSSRRADLLLGLSLRPQPARDRNDGDVEPLVMVDESGAAPRIVSDPDPNLSRWPLFGCVLVRRAGGGAPDWEIVGWFGRDQGLGRIEVSSQADAVGTIQSLPGGTWCEISLAVDGDNLLLWLDGRLIARKAGIIGTNPAAPYVRLDEQAMPIATQTVAVGIVERAPSAPQRAASIIDNVRLDRLGDAMSGTLPAGIILSDDLRVTCHPNGRVESSSASLGISSQSDATRATLAIDGSGNVTATVTP
jgi:type II secretory pathway pseudopilin PulG